MDLVRALQAGRERMEQLACAEGTWRGWGATALPYGCLIQTVGARILNGCRVH